MNRPILISLCCLALFPLAAQKKLTTGIHLDSVYLNRKLPILCKESQLFDAFGKPDSVTVEENWECGNYIDNETTVIALYYGKTRFIQSKDQVLLHVLDFESNSMSFDLADFSIRKGLKKSEFIQRFPESVFIKFEDREIASILMLPDYEAGNSKWIFSFRNGTIDSLELWWMIC